MHRGGGGPGAGVKWGGEHSTHAYEYMYTMLCVCTYCICLDPKDVHEGLFELYLMQDKNRERGHFNRFLNLQVPFKRNPLDEFTSAAPGQKT